MIKKEAIKIRNSLLILMRNCRISHSLRWLYRLPSRMLSQVMFLTLQSMRGIKLTLMILPREISEVGIPTQWVPGIRTMKITITPVATTPLEQVKLRTSHSTSFQMLGIKWDQPTFQSTSTRETTRQQVDQMSLDLE